MSRNKQRLGTLVFFLLLISSASITACSTPSAANATPTPIPAAARQATPTPEPTAPAAPRAIQRLPVAITGGVLPAPDGSLLVGWTVEGGVERPTVALYDLEGHVLGRYNSTNGLLLNALWLADSSAFLIWNQILDSSSKPGPIVVMDREGKIHSTGLAGINPVLSPDGVWLAATRLGVASDKNAVEIVSYAGGAVQTVIQGEDLSFLGWQGDQIVYFARGGIFAIPVRGGSATQLISLQPEDEITQPPDGPTSSPDGQVLIVLLNHQPSVLARGKLRSLAAGEPGVATLPAVASRPGLWAGPHESLGVSSQGELLIIDMLSGAVERRTGLGGVERADAVSWPWLAWRADTVLHATNLETKVNLNLGEEPVEGGIFPLGKGQFLLHGNGESYLIAPSLAGR